MHVPVLVVESSDERWAKLRAGLRCRGADAMAVRSAQQAAMVLDTGSVSVLVVGAVGSITDHQDLLLRLRHRHDVHVVLVTEAFSAEVVRAYTVFGPRVTMAQRDPAGVVAQLIAAGALNRAA